MDIVEIKKQEAYIKSGETNFTVAKKALEGKSEKEFTVALPEGITLEQVVGLNSAIKG